MERCKGFVGKEEGQEDQNVEKIEWCFEKYMY